MRYMLLAVMVVALVALAGCSSGPLVLAEDADGTAVDVKVGDTVIVELESNPSTGYSWQVTGEGPFELQGEPEFVQDGADDDRVGAGGIERFTFERTGDEQGTLRLEYRRPWEEPSVESEDTWSIEVD